MSTRLRFRVDLGTLVVVTCLASSACATAQYDRQTGRPSNRVELATVPALGAPFHGSGPPDHHELTSSSSTHPAYPVSVRGVPFVVAVSSSGTVIYVATTDPAFRTPEDIRVGSALADVLAAGAAAPWPEPGWGFWTSLPSGWHVAFVNGPSLTVEPLPPNATVRWLFRR